MAIQSYVVPVVKLQNGEVVYNVKVSRTVSKIKLRKLKGEKIKKGKGDKK